MARKLFALVGMALLVALAGVAAPPARADDAVEDCDDFIDSPNLTNEAFASCLGLLLLANPFFKIPFLESSSAQAASATAIADVFKLNNFGATLESGEPTVGGKMKKTVWGVVRVPQNRRIVIHTFGSEFNTVLAAYTGNVVNSLSLITSNDDTTVNGAANTGSLIQFNATANKRYSIQLGSKTGTEGDIYAAGFAFPPTGGLSAFMSTVGGRPWNSRDYVCGYGEAPLSPCSNPVFILHNSTNKPLIVTASSNLGAGVVAPATFSIAPNQVKTAQFKFTAAFNRTATRTVAGFFTFVGKANGVEIARAQHRALIVVGNATLGNVLRLTVDPAVRAGAINEAKPFDVKLTNTGAQPATGCHARHDFSDTSRLKVTWRRFNPSTGNYVAPLDQPVNIAAGQSASIRVFAASQQAQLADPEFPTQVTLDCANTNPALSNLANVFDLTAFGLYRPVQAEATKLAPAGETLLVPSAGGSFRVRVVNHSPTTELRALAIYARPFDECCDPKKQFTITICQLASANGACLAPSSPNSVEYSAPKDVPKFFKVMVKPPATNPGFDPTKRRVFFKLRQDAPIDTALDAVVAAESVAVRKN